MNAQTRMEGVAKCATTQKAATTVLVMTVGMRSLRTANPAKVSRP